MTLIKVFKQWDGKSTDFLETVYANYSENYRFADEIIEAIQYEEFQNAATWQLKRFCANEGCLNHSQIDVLSSSLLSLTNWEAKLHVLQTTSFLPFPTATKTLWESFFRNCITDENKFVRAWGYSGFYELSCQIIDYRKEAVELIEMAYRDEPASVKARIRQLVKKDSRSSTRILATVSV